MEELLVERLDILKAAGMMESSIEKSIYYIIEKLEADGIEAKDDNIGMFLTHLIAAINRKINKNEIKEINVELKKEFENNYFYPQAKRYFSIIEKKLGFELGEAEKIYIGGYLCILLAKAKEDEG